MNIISALASGPTAFRGPGVNHANEAFTGTLSVQPLEGGLAILLNYSATLESGTVVHSESTLLGTGPDGRLCLWPVMSEIPVVLPHTELMTRTEPGKYTLTVFASGTRDNSTIFREEITIQLNGNGSVVYSHAWGLPGGNLEDRSSCSMAPSGA